MTRPRTRRRCARARGSRHRRGHDRLARRHARRHRRRKGAWLGLADGAAVASGQSFDTVAGAVAERLLDGGREILTLLTGADEPQLESLVGEIGARHPEIEIEIHAGGQPHYPLLLSAE